MTFDEYLIEKKINGPLFRAEEPERWREWSELFEQVSPSSFTSQKLYLINSIRRRYTLQADQPRKETSSPARPVFKPKIK